MKTWLWHPLLEKNLCSGPDLLNTFLGSHLNSYASTLFLRVYKEDRLNFSDSCYLLYNYKDYFGNEMVNFCVSLGKSKHLGNILRGVLSTSIKRHFLCLRNAVENIKGRATRVKYVTCQAMF